jgi:hypothetical protein
MSPHSRHTVSDLSDALQHVVYEMWKYQQSVVDYSKILEVGGDAAIEFRVLHHRVLLEFFYGPAKHRDNIVAWEFIDNWQSTHNRAGVVWLEDYMNRCHTLLAHVSTTRTELQKRGLKAWDRDWLVVEPHLDLTISDFLGGLSSDYRKICQDWVNRWINGNHQGMHALKEVGRMIEVH